MIPFPEARSQFLRVKIDPFFPQFLKSSLNSDLNVRIQEKFEAGSGKYDRSNISTVDHGPAIPAITALEVEEGFPHDRMCGNH